MEIVQGDSVVASGSLNDSAQGSLISEFGTSEQVSIESPTRMFDIPGTSTVDTDSFWNAIKDVTMANGMSTSSVLRPVAAHKSRFHYRITDGDFGHRATSDEFINRQIDRIEIFLQ